MAGIKSLSLLLRSMTLLLVFQSTLAAKEGGQVSCMTRYLTQSGAKLSDAAVYESSFRKSSLTIPKVLATNTFFLSFAMGGNYAHAKNLQQCLARKRGGCKSFYPCSKRGRCFLNRRTARFACKCPPGQSGKFCRRAINECASNPCLNGGRCRDGVNMFTCSCRLGYEGSRCQTKWLLKSHHKPVPAALNKLQAEFRVMQRDFKKEISQIQNSPVKLSGCHTTDVGYTYKQYNEKHNDVDTGELNHLNYNKKRDDTVLLITYSSNIRTLGKNKAARWYVKVDGRECSVPSRVGIAMYDGSGDNPHIPGVLMGVCQATAAGHLRRGTHRISIHVGATREFYLADAFTGWRSSSLLQVKEMCPSY